jgi:hypothetical protein
MSSRYVALHGLKPPVNAASPLGHRRGGTAEARHKGAPHDALRIINRLALHESRDITDGNPLSQFIFGSVLVPAS